VKTCALENAKYGVTCNSIVLGYSDGGLTYTIPKEFLEKVVSDIPMKRLCRVDEIHRAVRFLIDTEYATGTNLVLAGGLL
jgi:acetoacetyl-CoA reductase